MNYRIAAVFKLILQVFWPPAAPISIDAVNSSSKWWITTCIVNIIPSTAVLHHTLFYPRSCIANPYYLYDYSWPLLSSYPWFLRDPSLPWAVVVMIIMYVIGNKLSWVKVFIAPIFLSFLPLSIWIWDIPFSKRFICRNFHFEHSITPVVSTKYIYALGIILYFAFIIYIVRKKKGVDLKQNQLS